jgi:hypothetical protein
MKCRGLPSESNSLPPLDLAAARGPATAVTACVEPISRVFSLVCAQLALVAGVQRNPVSGPTGPYRRIPFGYCPGLTR